LVGEKTNKKCGKARKSVWLARKQWKMTKMRPNTYVKKVSTHLMYSPNFFAPLAIYEVEAELGFY
jgi:hypothetical protein